MVETLYDKTTMGTMNFSVPDDIEYAFNTIFADQNKSAIIAELMREAVERAERQARSQLAAKRILARRKASTPVNAAAIRRARDAGCE